MNDETSQKNVELLRETISENFPELQISTLSYLGEGWDSVAILVNSELVFRFPKNKEVADTLETEKRLLPPLRKIVSLSIPDFIYFGKQKNGLPFVGYKKIPGEILGEYTVPTLSEKKQDEIAKTLAKFIGELISFPIEEARELGVREESAYDDYSDTFEHAKKDIYPLIEPGMQEYLNREFKSYLENKTNITYQPNHIHADLSPNHFIVDPNNTLMGIIDFGDVNIGDPDYEYLYILQDCGESFTRKVMSYRKLDNIDLRLKKIAFYVVVDHVGYIFEGMRRGDQNMINRGISAIHDAMKNN